MTVPEENIQEAIALVREGTSQKDAAAAWGVPPPTLSGRLHGRQSNKTVKISKQKLTPAQERFIADWALSEEHAGRAPNRKRLRGFAQLILMEGGDKTPLGARWVNRFLNRHPNVHTKNSAPLESARVRGSTKEAYEDFFQRLDQKIKSRNIKPANIANMDEHGMQEMETATGKVIGSAFTNRTYIQILEGTTWVSVIECGTVEGKRLSPVVVFTGASLQGQWFPEKEEMEKKFMGYKFDYSLTGWSNALIARKWMKEVYLPETKPGKGEWRLLIIDEHLSHIDDEFQHLAYTN